MPISKNYNSDDLNPKGSRRLVIITGYYGFDNLGDEAILEELLCEVSSMWDKDNIIVLSNHPELTAALYEVKSINRWQLFKQISLFWNAALLISGGGGLFQDRSGPRSVIFYAAQIILAKLLGAKVLIYAQGLGPLKSAFGTLLTRLAFSFANVITLRDSKSINLLKSWGLKGILTADPVWALSASPLPDSVNALLTKLRDTKDKVIGLSLREDSALKDYHLKYLAEAIATTFPQSSILLLPLQQNQDFAVLKKEEGLLKKLGMKTALLDSSLLSRPSDWIALMEKLDLVVGMRLHALLMALRVSRPVIGIAYDPKVSILLHDFDQPLLSLDGQEQEKTKDIWLETIKACKDLNFSQAAEEKVIAAKQLAQQNAIQLAIILRG